ncbi:MAG: four helix bundle protein [Nitrospiria bacterium]
MRIERFEDLDCWKKARSLVNQIYAMSRKGDFAKDYELRDQIRRASVSVLSNIAEGFERGSNTEFIQFLYIAKGSVGEVISQLYVAMDQGYVLEKEFVKVHGLAGETSKMIGGLIVYLKSTKIKGPKYSTRNPELGPQNQELGTSIK